MPSSARCTNFREGRPAAAKREAGQCDDHPDEVGTIRHGTAASTSQKTQACPKARQNRSRHRYVDPRRAEGHCTEACLSGLFFWTVHGPFSFRPRPKGAPAAPRAAGRGGARERAQFSPQAETELSGLCDDTMGGASRWTSPLREQTPPAIGQKTRHRRIRSNSSGTAPPPRAEWAHFQLYFPQFYISSRAGTIWNSFSDNYRPSPRWRS